MPSVMIADTRDGAADLGRILNGHELTFVSTMKAALTKLQKHSFDLIVVGLHFDESRMFEVITEVKKSKSNASTPVICFCSRNTEMALLMHKSLEISTRLLGAWMYLSEHAYNVYQNPDAELRRVMERCLTEETRKENLQQRIDIQRQRTDIQNLRVILEGQEWTPKMSEYLEGLRHDLESLLYQVTSLNSSATIRRASVQSSRALKDRVSDQVTINENQLTKEEEVQSENESRQTSEENEVAAKEEIKEALARQRQRDRLENGLGIGGDLPH